MKNAGTSGLRWPQLSLLAVGLMIVCLASPSWAQQDIYWIGGPSAHDWGAPANWDGGVVPGADDNAYLHQTDANNRTVNYRNILSPNPAATLAGVYLNASGTGNMTLQLGVAGVPGQLIANEVVVGVNNRGVLTQSNGSLTAPGNLILGSQSGSSGRFTLSGGALAPVNTVVGDNGAGIFTQTGGTHTVGYFFTLGRGSNGTGTYNLQGGDVASGYLVVGAAGTGIFNQSNGTSITIASSLGMAEQPGSHGEYNLQSGTVNANELYTGQGTGTFNQTGGSLNLNNLFLGRDDGGTGRYNLTGGALATGNTAVGNYGAGTFSQNGGTHTVTGELDLGTNAGSTGTYNLQTGAVSSAYLFVGYNGAGTFNQTGGSVALTGHIGVGREEGSTGVYNLQGGTFSTFDLYVGYGGTGTFNQAAGAINMAGTIDMAQLSTGRATYNLQAGSLTAANLYVGQAGIGTFNQSLGTTLNLTDLFVISQAGTSLFNQVAGTTNVTGDLGVGRDPGSHGQYDFQSGTLNTNNVYLGYEGTGVFNQTGGTHTAAGYFILGDRPTGSGTYNLVGGSLSANDLFVGGDGIGDFNQSGNTTTFTIANFLGVNNGTYDLTGGALTTLEMRVGGGGAAHGAFNQSGASTVTVTNFLGLGDGAGRTGTYNLMNGALSLAGMFIGNAGGTGFFNQTGGTATLSGDMYLGPDNNGTGTYNLQNGQLTVNTILVSTLGTGIFNQSGGAATATTVNLNPRGIFNQTGGTLNFTDFNHQGGEVRGSLQNLLGGTYTYDSGTFTGRLLNYGTAIFNNNFTAGNGMGLFTNLTLNAGRSLTFNGQGLTVDGSGLGGLFTQTGGTLTVTNSIIGNTGIGTFTQSGGTHLVNSILTLAANPGSTGTYNLQNGTLSAGTINLNTGGLLHQTGGTLNFTNLNLTGGTYQGNLDNQGILTGTGPIIGSLTNRGTVNPGNSPGTLSVQGSFTQPAGGNYVCEVASATNYDKIAVTGAPGTATVGGTLTPKLLGGYVPSQTQVFPGIITATGGITGQFSAIASPLPWALRYSANSVDLLYEILAQQGYNFADPGLPLTGNQRKVGVMLNEVQDNATGDLGRVLDVLSQLSGGASTANAYQQITPDKASAMPALSLAGSRMQAQFLNNRASYIRYSRSGSPMFSGGGGSFNASYSRLAGLMLAYNGSDLGSLISRDRPDQKSDNPWGIYTNFVSTLGNQNSSINQTGYDFSTFGFFSGADYRVRDNLILGLGSGYYHTASSFSGSGGSVAVNSIPFYAYGTFFPGSFYVTGSIGYTLNLYGLDRNINFGGLNRVANSSVTGSQFNINGETGYDLNIRGLILTPAVSLYYSQAWVGGFTESGANSMNLKVSAQSTDSIQTGVGVRVSRPFKAGNTPVLPQVSAFYQHEFSNDSKGMDARLAQTASTFSFRTDPPRRDFAVLGAGVAVAVKKNLFVQANYNAEVGRGNYTAHYVSAGLRWEF